MSKEPMELPPVAETAHELSAEQKMEAVLEKVIAEQLLSIMKQTMRTIMKDSSLQLLQYALQGSNDGLINDDI